MLPLRTILHPTDFSEHAQSAFLLACSLARDYGARLLLLHVGKELMVMPVEGVAPPEPAHYREELTEELLMLRAQAPEVSIEPQLIVGGHPAGQIVRVARERKADLIVLGTHGRTGVGRFLLGSVAEEVLRKAPCPVLTAKSPLPGEQLGGEPVPTSSRTGTEVGGQ
jgi:nucleotide-binding universal stress UspA family protein